MSEAPVDKQKVVFALGQNPNGAYQVVLLMPPEAWDYMATGLAHEFDLTKMGVPIQIIIGRCATQDEGKAMLGAIHASQGKPTKDVSHMDVRIFEPDKEFRARIQAVPGITPSNSLAASLSVGAELDALGAKFGLKREGTK